MAFGPVREILLRVRCPRRYKRLALLPGHFLDRRKLDSIDFRILSELQTDGRVTNVELSRRAGITAPPCLRRIRALEKAGFIRGYHAELDGKLLGFEVTGFVFVGLERRGEAESA